MAMSVHLYNVHVHVHDVCMTCVCHVLQLETLKHRYDLRIVCEPSGLTVLPPPQKKSLMWDFYLFFKCLMFPKKIPQRKA